MSVLLFEVSPNYSYQMIIELDRDVRQELTMGAKSERNGNRGEREIYAFSDGASKQNARWSPVAALRLLSTKNRPRVYGHSLNRLLRASRSVTLFTERMQERRLTVFALKIFNANDTRAHVQFFPVLLARDAPASSRVSPLIECDASSDQHRIEWIAVIHFWDMCFADIALREVVDIRWITDVLRSCAGCLEQRMASRDPSVSSKIADDHSVEVSVMALTRSVLAAPLFRFKYKKREKAIARRNERIYRVKRKRQPWTICQCLSLLWKFKIISVMNLAALTFWCL